MGESGFSLLSHKEMTWRLFCTPFPATSGDAKMRWPRQIVAFLGRDYCPMYHCILSSSSGRCPPGEPGCADPPPAGAQVVDPPWRIGGDSPYPIFLLPHEPGTSLPRPPLLWKRYHPQVHPHGLLSDDRGSDLSVSSPAVGENLRALGRFGFLSLPVVVHLSITAYVDLGLAFFTAAAIMGLFRWSNRGFHPFWLVGSGICCGLALGVKYNALVVFFLLVLTVLYLAGTKDRSEGGPGPFRALAWAVIYIMVALTVFSPWMIRNYRLKGRPFYPIRVPVVSRLFIGTGGGNQAVQQRTGRVPLDHFSYRRFAFGNRFGKSLQSRYGFFFKEKTTIPKILMVA